LQAIKITPTAFSQDTNQVNDPIGPFNSASYACLISEICVERHNLTHRTHRLEKQRAFRIRNRNPHNIAARCQAFDHIAPDEAGTAENR